MLETFALPLSTNTERSLAARAPANIGINRIADHYSLMRLEAHRGERLLEDTRLRLADDGRLRRRSSLR